MFVLLDIKLNLFSSNKNETEPFQRYQSHQINAERRNEQNNETCQRATDLTKDPSALETADYDYRVDQHSADEIERDQGDQKDVVGRASVLVDVECVEQAKVLHKTHGKQNYENVADYFQFGAVDRGLVDSQQPVSVVKVVANVSRVILV